MIQCNPPVTQCNNLSLAGKRPVRIKLPLTQIQYLHEVPGFAWRVTFKHLVHYGAGIAVPDRMTE